MQEKSQYLKLIAEYFALDDARAEALLADFTPASLKSGQWLFQAGEPADCLYFLVRGRMQVWTGNSETEPEVSRKDDALEQSLLGEVAAGETVGEVGLLTGQPRSAGVRAIRDCALLKLDRKAFERLCAEHPALALRLAGDVAGRLHQRTSMAGTGGTRLTNICLLPLDPDPATDEFCTRLYNEMKPFGPTLHVRPEDLPGSEAPVDSLDPDEPVPESIKAWLSRQEEAGTCCIYQCPPGNSYWSRFALRQADLVVLVGQSGNDPELAAHEQALEIHADGGLSRSCLILLHSGQTIRNTAAWLEPRRCDFHLHVRDNNKADVQRAARVLAGKAIGLVLGSGSALGFAHVGVYRAMMELGLPVDWVGGTSMGALIGASIAQGKDPDQVRDMAYRGIVKIRPFTNFTLPVVSLSSGNRMRRSIRRSLPGHIEDLPLPFFCVSSVLDDGSVNIHRDGLLADAANATAALPGMFPPTVVDGRLSVDGSVVNALPVDIMLRQPVGKVIAVDLSSHALRTVNYDRLPSAWRILAGRWLPGLFRRYPSPGIGAMILKATELGGRERIRAARAAADLVLNPPVHKFGMTDLKAFDRLVETGYDDARIRLEAWMASQKSKE